MALASLLRCSRLVANEGFFPLKNVPPAVSDEGARGGLDQHGGARRSHARKIGPHVGGACEHEDRLRRRRAAKSHPRNARWRHTGAFRIRPQKKAGRPMAAPWICPCRWRPAGRYSTAACCCFGLRALYCLMTWRRFSMLARRRSAAARARSRRAARISSSDGPKSEKPVEPLDV